VTAGERKEISGGTTRIGWLRGLLLVAAVVGLGAVPAVVRLSLGGDPTWSTAADEGGASPGFAW
jgi:hypothetical protein